MKYGYLILCVSLSLFVAGCANPLNRATSDRYSQTCAEAEERGNMKVAAEACYRAYVNVEWGNLGPEIRSEKLYNFGRVLRKAGRYDDAREALTRAIAEEEKLSGRNSQKSGRRIAELAATYIELNQQDQGLGLVDELIPIADGYSPGEKQFIAALLYYYRQHLGNLHPEKSAAYKAKMKDLGYSEDYFEKQR